MNALKIAWLMGQEQCTWPKCRAKFKGLIELEGKYPDITWKPNADFLFHYQDTHGMPHDIMVEEFEKIINAPMSQEEVETYNSFGKAYLEFKHDRHI